MGVTSSKITPAISSGVNEEAIKVSIVSSSCVMRIGLRQILESCEKVVLVGELSERINAVEVIGREKPDVVLVDLDLPDVLDLIRTLRQAVPDSVVLVLSGLNDYGSARQALSAGASGVVLDVQPPGVLVAAIESLCPSGSSVKTPAIESEPHPSEATHSETESQEPAGISSLTAREREVISLLAKGLTNKDIADQLCISETTVRHHLTNIFNKLDVSSRQKLLILAHRHRLVELTRHQAAYQATTN
jgi:DNA-binding NarL/FixJ family response regulator